MSKSRRERRTKRPFGGWVGRVKHGGEMLPGYYFKALDRVTGRRVQRRGGATAEEAEAALSKFRSDAVAIEATGVRGVTLGEFARNEHLPVFETRVGARHAEIVRAQLERAAAHFKSTPLHTIERAHVETYFAELRRGGLCPATLRRHAAALSGLWRSAIDRNAARENPVRSVAFGRVQEFAVRYLTPDEVARIVAQTPDQVRPVVAFLAGTGFRYGEAMNLRWQAVEDGFGRVTVARAKSGRVRLVPLTPTAHGVLRELHAARAVPTDGAEFVFARYSHGHTFRLFKRAVAAAGLTSSTRLHDLRHAYASQMVQVGVPISTVAEVIGDTLAVAMRYASHVPASAAAQAVHALALARGETLPARTTRRRRSA
jgi:integrase